MGDINSITKSVVSDEKIAKIIKKAFGQDSCVEEIKELKEGFFNTAYLITLSNGSRTVLKVSPPKNVRVMRYEKDIIVNEVYVLKRVHVETDVPVPRVLLFDRSGQIIENDYFLIDFVPGCPLNGIYDNLTEQRKESIALELAKYAKGMGSIKSGYFGDISATEKQFTSWRDTFLFMIGELLEDARDKNVKLPYKYDIIYQMIKKQSGALDDVKEASLVHKDLWRGNIFVDRETVKILGIIDCERAIFGDSLMEPVCGFHLEDSAFMKSFMGRDYLTVNEKIRTTLYRIYLFLIMVIECSFRQYICEENSKWPIEQLEAALNDLSHLDAAT